jgi:hypothetical protein
MLAPIPSLALFQLCPLLPLRSSATTSSSTAGVQVLSGNRDAPARRPICSACCLALPRPLRVVRVASVSSTSPPSRCGALLHPHAHKLLPRRCSAASVCNKRSSVRRRLLRGPRTKAQPSVHARLRLCTPSDRRQARYNAAKDVHAARPPPRPPVSDHCISVRGASPLHPRS